MVWDGLEVLGDDVGVERTVFGEDEGAMGMTMRDVARTVFFGKGNRDIVFGGVLLRLGVLG